MIWKFRIVKSGQQDMLNLRFLGETSSCEMQFKKKQNTKPIILQLAADYVHTLFACEYKYLYSNTKCVYLNIFACTM